MAAFRMSRKLSSQRRPPNPPNRGGCPEIGLDIDRENANLRALGLRRPFSVCFLARQWRGG